MQLLLLPKDSADNSSAIVEIRAGTGGEEASLFAGDLLKMYTRYAQLQGWKAELLSLSESDLGGVKEAVLGDRKARAPMPSSNSNPACIACSACR